MGFCSLSLSHTHTRTHAPYTHPYLGTRRSSGCAWTHLNEAQRGVYVFLRQGVCVVYFSVCVNARVLARPLLPAPVQTNREQQQSIRNFLHPRRKISGPQGPRQGKSLDYESASEEKQKPSEREAMSPQRKKRLSFKEKGSRSIQAWSLLKPKSS